MNQLSTTLGSRRDYFEISDEDLERVKRLRPFLERHIDRMMSALYDFLVRHAETRAFLPDDATIARVKEKQREFFLGFLRARFDEEYFADRRRVGLAAERIGLPPTLYVGAYSVFMRALQDALHEEFTDPAEANLGFNSFRKLAFLDQALTIETFVAAREKKIAAQEAAIRELSTPVIELRDRVLLLPIVGALDDARSRQVTATVLARVAESRARSVIIDISGVATMDSQVARSLLDTAAAIRLLGAATIISGVSAEVAESIVRLGLDTMDVVTVSHLSDATALLERS